MSMTKSFFHEEICEMMADENEYAEYFAYSVPKVDETEINWFSGYRLAFDGYQEFECHLCGGYNTTDELHPECEERERAWLELGEEDLPF